jgi:hypothetical protein
MKKTAKTLTALASVALMASAHAYIVPNNPVTYVPSDSAVTFQITSTTQTEGLVQINPDTGLPDPTLPLVFQDTWTDTDTNGVVIRLYTASQANIVTTKIGNADILQFLVNNAEIPGPIQGYSIVQRYNIDGTPENMHVVKKGIDVLDLGPVANISNLIAVAYKTLDIDNSANTGGSILPVHKGSSTLLGPVALNTTFFGGILPNVLNALGSSSTVDKTWNSVSNGNTNQNIVTLAGATTLSGVTGSGTDVNGLASVYQGSINISSSKLKAIPFFQ